MTCLRPSQIPYSKTRLLYAYVIHLATIPSYQTCTPLLFCSNSHSLISNKLWRACHTKIAWILLSRPPPKACYPWNSFFNQWKTYYLYHLGISAIKIWVVQLEASALFTTYKIQIPGHIYSRKCHDRKKKKKLARSEDQDGVFSAGWNQVS